MVQDIFPHVYHNQYSDRRAAAEGDFIFVFSGRDLLCRVEQNALILPTLQELGPAYAGAQYLFSIDDRAYFLHEGETPAAPEGWEYKVTRPLRSLLSDQQLFAMANAESLHRWYGANRFCGRCGHPMEHDTVERMQKCPACGLHVYPKIMPAVIVLVHDGDRVVLTKYANSPIKHYALIAGFNEIGESIEETVHREVLEEVGLRVKNLRFYKSQPWTFTDSLLMGFTAELDGSDKIVRQEDELSIAQWFDRAEIPDAHSPISLTGEMMEQFRANKL